MANSLVTWYSYELSIKLLKKKWMSLLDRIWVMLPLMVWYHIPTMRGRYGLTPRSVAVTEVWHLNQFWPLKMVSPALIHIYHVGVRNSPPFSSSVLVSSAFASLCFLSSPFDYFSPRFVSPKLSFFPKRLPFSVPSAPRGLEGTQSTSSTITLLWRRPTTMNGILRAYQITIKEHINVTMTLNVTQHISEDTVTYTVTGLRPFTVYNITVSFGHEIGEQNKNIF